MTRLQLIETEIGLEAIAEGQYADYEAALAEWRAACRAWAEEETARLWQPWHVWKVRYVAYDALFSAAAAEEQAPIETVYTLDEPGDIVRAMTPVALVDRVDVDGKVTAGFALATFLDGVRVDFALANVASGMRFHRTYHAGGYCVNVPAFMLEGPAPAPAPVRPESPKAE